jgi:hypothetical protein
MVVLSPATISLTGVEQTAGIKPKPAESPPRFFAGR